MELGSWLRESCHGVGENHSGAISVNGSRKGSSKYSGSAASVKVKESGSCQRGPK